MRIETGDFATIHVAANMWVDMVLEKRPDWKPNIDWWMTIAAQNMAAGHYSQLFAIDGDEAIGFGDFFMFPEPSTGEIHCVGQHLYVKPEYRGTWAASRLVRAWNKVALDMGATKMELFAFQDEQGRWKKVGFEPVRVLMRKGVKHV